MMLCMYKNGRTIRDERKRGMKGGSEGKSREWGEVKLLSIIHIGTEENYWLRVVANMELFKSIILIKEN